MEKLNYSHPTSVPLATEGTEQGIEFSEALVGRISVSSMVDAAAQSIRDAIITGRLRPGMRLVERKLATALGIGQPTLREALKELEYQGFVCKTPQRGTHVSNFTRDELRKIMEVRIILEAFAVERAAIHMTAEAELKLEALLGQMSGGANNFDLAAFHDADVGFHRVIWALAGNEYLSASLEGMALRLFVFGALSRGPNQFRAVVEQHKGILEGLRSRDPEKARAAFISHILNFWKEYDSLGAELNVSLTDNPRHRT